MTTSLQDSLRTGFERSDRDGLPVLYRYLRPSDDIDALTELLHAAYAPLAAAGMRFVASYQDAETTRRRAAKGETIVAATREGIIGTVTLATVQSTHGSPFYDRADVASVGQFGVAPPHQGRGIGSNLMDLVEERARELGVAYLALDTSEHAHGLVDLYSRRGYHFIEYVQWQDVNYRSVVMAKTLAASDSIQAQASVRAALHAITLVIAAVSCVAYAYFSLGTARPPTAAFVIIPPVSW